MKRALWIKSCFILLLGFFAMGHGAVCAAEKLVLQLPWHHQFQFAGYYMAKENGYYNDAGLDVEIRDISQGENSVEEVLSGRADLGVNGSGLLVERSLGNPVVAIAAIFQHDPAVFLSLEQSGIREPADFVGRKVMLVPGFQSLSLMVLLHQEGVLDKIERLPTSFDYRSLLNGETDVFNAYRTNEPYLLDEQGYQTNIINPEDYNINFYGDILFTSEGFIQNNPKLVEKFRTASLKGWDYALKHPDETIAVIKSKYPVNKTVQQLQFEATAIEKVIQPDLVEIGTMDLARWAQMSQHLMAIGQISPKFHLSSNFLYELPRGIQWQGLKFWIAGVLAVFVILVIFISIISKGYFHLRTTRKKLRKEIEERKQTEKELSLERDNLNSIFEAMDDGVYIVNKEFDIQYVNPVLTKDLGCYEGRKCYEYFHDRTDVCPWCKNDEILKGETVRWEWYLPKTNRTYDLIDTPIKQADGSILKLEIFRDITEHKQAEEVLRESENKFRMLADHTTDWIYWRDPEGKYLYVSPACERMTGYRSDEFLSNSDLLFDLIIPAYRERTLQHYQDENSQASPFFTMEFPIIAKNGKERWLEHNCSPIFDKQGRFLGRRGNNRDITERKQAEKFLRRYAHVVSETGDQMSFIDRNYVYQVVNEAYLQTYQKLREDIIGHSVKDLHGTDIFEQIVKANLDRCFAGEEIHYQEWFEFPKQGRRFMDVAYYPYTEDDGVVSGVVVSTHDITEIQQLEEERSQLLQAIDQSSETIVVTDTTGTIQYVNPAFEKSSGYTCEEAIGQNPRILKSGQQDDHFYQEMWRTLTRGEVWRGRLVNKNKDGSLYSEETTISAVLNTSGDVVNYVALKRDVTHEVEMEEQLRQKYKMEAVGIMAGGMAHNFNNNLSIILGNVELSLHKLAENSEAVPLLNNAKIAVLRSRDLIQQILTYSRKGGYRKTAIQLPPIVDESLQLLQSTMPSTINVFQTVSMSIRDVAIYGDASQVQEVVVNLCNNAVHAMDEVGDLSITLEVVDLKHKDIPAQHQCLPGCYTMLSIQDSGAGMSAETTSKIFDLFFTTKEVGKGTGVGLSTVQGIVDQHGGLIKVKSNLGKGTTFEIYFPIIERRQKERTPVVQELPEGTEKILFVDDEEMLANVWSEMLREHGYQVSMMTSSTEALKLFAANPDDFDLVITDQTMPELVGRDLILELLKIRPNLATILCTGYSSKINADEAKEVDIKAFFVKPLDISELLQTVRRVLDERKN